MRLAGKAIAALLVGVMLGATPLPICTPTAEFQRRPLQGNISATAVRSYSDVATEPAFTRLLLSTHVESRTSDSFTLSTRLDAPSLRSAFIRIGAINVAPESVARVPVRGRAPPV